MALGPFARSILLSSKGSFIASVEAGHAARKVYDEANFNNDGLQNTKN